MKNKITLNDPKFLNVLGLCETFLDEEVDNTEIYIDGFRCERRDRI